MTAAEPRPDIRLPTKACAFAARKHTRRRRKGVAAEPYSNHLTDVAVLLARMLDRAVAFAGDGALICCALPSPTGGIP